MDKFPTKFVTNQLCQDELLLRSEGQFLIEVLQLPPEVRRSLLNQYGKDNNVRELIRNGLTEWVGRKGNATITELQEKLRQAGFQSAAGKGELVDILTLFTLPKL